MTEKTLKLTEKNEQKKTLKLWISVFFSCTVWGIRTPDFQDENLASWAG